MQTRARVVFGIVPTSRVDKLGSSRMHAAFWNTSHPVKSRSLILPVALLGMALGASALWTRAETAPSAAAVAPLYVTIDAFEPIEFSHMRRALADGSELILATLKQCAAGEARFAQYPGEVRVLAEKETPPPGAAVLRLTWTGHAVVGDWFPSPGSKPVNLGVVSSTPLMQHPDYDRMHAEIRNGLSAQRRDAELRALTRMNLYLALQRVSRGLKS